MRFRLSALFLMLTLAAVPAWAQETRGNINGTVQDATGAVPGATVRITNVDTNQTQQLITNGSGYFEAPLLQAGRYKIAVEMSGFKTLTQSGIVLSVGQSLTMKLSLDVGQLTENVNVVAQSSLLDTTSVSSGQNFDSKLLEGLPISSNQPILLTKFAQGIVGPTTQQQVLQGQIDGPNDGAGTPVGGVGSFNYTLDGATNAGNSRRMASSPNSDMIQELRVETSNFDAAQGHGTGANVSLMTRAGTNTVRGTTNYTFWSNEINSLNPQQKLAFSQRPDTGKIYASGHSNNIAFTLGGPVVIPKLVDGRSKLFFFASYQSNLDDSPARNTPTSTVPYNNKYLQGDFSDLLKIPNGSTYQIYDPLTVRANPAIPGGFIRTPFPNNIIPKDRFMNPDGSYKNQLFALFADMMPPPNQNFIEDNAVPTGNYYQGGTPNLTSAKNFSGRLDYNLSGTDRFFFRAAGTTFHEQLGDWTYETTKYKGLHVNDKTRMSWAYTGNWTKVHGSTVIDSQLAANRFFEDQQRRGAHKFTPTSLGLPSYLDDFCTAAQNCMLPVINVAGYQSISLTADGGVQSTNFQGQSNITSVKGSHTLRGGVDVRVARYQTGLITAGNVSSTYNFDNTYTRERDAAKTGEVSIGLSLAALMLGLPSTVSIGTNAPLSMSNPYYGLFFQDSWRVNRNLTINAGLRYEYEDGIKEAGDRWITAYDPTAKLAITDAAQAAYAKSPITQVPVSQFSALGGSVYATAPGGRQRTWNGESMWMPRFAAAYKLGDKTVIKGGYGLFFDTLNAADYTGANQNGYSVTTTNPVSSNFGQTWLLGDPKNGVSPLINPFPVRLDGNRFESPIADSLGADTIVGTGFSVENPDRKHARVQRWRIGIQREVFRNTAVEVAYSGSYADRVAMNVPEQYVPEQYYSTVTNVRDASAQTLLQQNVTNPFLLSNFASLATTNPVLYQRMAASTFFTATTVQRQNLLRGYPQLSGFTINNLPLGIVKDHSFELTVNRRYSAGLSSNLAFSVNRTTENRRVEAYERVPTIWQSSQSSRPFRLTGGAVYEFPFGARKPFLKNGGILSKMLGGWQTGATFEYQPGSLLGDWGSNLVFNGDLKNIAKDNPEIALQRDGTIDASKTWFNTEAGFEKVTGNLLASFQKRSFPFRVDGVRGPSIFLVNMNLVRSFDIGGRRSLQFRMQVDNLLDAPLWNNPSLDPTSTNFGKITSATNSVMRFFTFGARVTF